MNAILSLISPATLIVLISLFGCSSPVTENFAEQDLGIDGKQALYAATFPQGAQVGSDLRMAASYDVMRTANDLVSGHYLSEIYRIEDDLSRLLDDNRHSIGLDDTAYSCGSTQDSTGKALIRKERDDTGSTLYYFSLDNCQLAGRTVSGTLTQLLKTERIWEFSSSLSISGGEWTIERADTYVHRQQDSFIPGSCSERLATTQIRSNLSNAIITQDGVTLSVRDAVYSSRKDTYPEQLATTGGVCEGGTAITFDGSGNVQSSALSPSRLVVRKIGNIARGLAQRIGDGEDNARITIGSEEDQYSLAVILLADTDSSVQVLLGDGESINAITASYRFSE